MRLITMIATDENSAMQFAEDIIKLVKYTQLIGRRVQVVSSLSGRLLANEASQAQRRCITQYRHALRVIISLISSASDTIHVAF